MLMLIIALAAAPGQGQPPVQTVDRVDLQRYAGEWFEIARFPNDFQDHCARDVRARYTLRDDGRVDVVNTCVTAEGKIDEAEGVARIVDRATSARLEVRFAPAILSFLPGVWGDYWIIGLAPDYSWAVVGSPDRKYLWVLSRTRRLDDAAYEKALDAARANGFDESRLVKTPQTQDR